MPTIYQLPIQQPAMVGVFPNQKFAVFGDNLATITTAGYLNQVSLESNPLSRTDILQVLYSFNNVTQTGTYGVFTVSINNSGVITLVAAGGVLGTAATKAASNNALSTVASTAGSGFTAGHVVTAADAAGTIQDSGSAFSALQLSANIKAARTANIGGGGAGPTSVVVAGLTAASIVTASIQASTNPVEIQKVTATATGFDILFSGDPGATCTVNYAAFVAAQ